MRLVHFCKKKFKFDFNLKYPEPDTFKPIGLWVSDESAFGWNDWCKGEGFRLESLHIQYDVILKKHANILKLASPADIDFFTRQFKSKTVDDFHSYIKWDEVKTQYQGIIISPYQYSRRLTPHTFWYYGWDCASGCIWDLAAIDEFIFKNIPCELQIELNKH